MGWKSSVRVAIVAAAALLLVAPFRAFAPFPVAKGAAQGSEEVRAERLRAAKERWNRMSPEERKRIKERFEEWRRLPEERQKELRRQFDDLGGREGAEQIRTQIRRTPPAHLARMRTADAEIRRMWKLAVESLPPKARDRLDSAPPEVQEWRRRQFAKACVAHCREALVERHATPEERKAVEGQDRAAKRAAHESLRRRVMDEVLAPHREALAGLPEDERRARAARLFDEHAWRVFRESRPDRVRRLGAVLEARDGRPPREGRQGREWFQRDFGVSEEELGVRWAPKVLMLAADPYRRDRAAVLEALRPELKRIAGLPLPERGPALRAALERVR
jgi:hypothetical protein